MKQTSIAQTFCLLLTVALFGCSTNPTVSGGGSIQDFARGLDRKKFEFDQTGKVWVPSMSGTLMTAQRIPQGLLVALAPAKEHCTREGGEASFTKLQAAGEAQLPLRALCQRNGAALWALDLAYDNVARVPSADSDGRMTLLYLKMTARAQYLPAESLAARLRDEQAQDQANDQASAARRDREAARELERMQLAKSKEIEVQRVAAQWPARVAAFQANLKVGDRFKWGRAPIWGGPFVGMVVKVEGALAFVQFDNLTFAGQQTRYLPKAELEPFDGPAPGGRGTIN